MAQVIIAGSNVTISGNTTRYQSLMGLTVTPQTADTLAASIIPTNGTIKSLAFRPSASPVQNATASLFVNGSATALSCTTNSASIAHDSVSVVRVNAGDSVSIRIAVTAGATSRFYSHSVIFTPTTPGHSIVMGNSNATPPTANQFVGIADVQSPNSTEANSRLVIPEANGIFKNLYIKLDEAPTGTTSETFTFFNNSVAGNNTVTITSASTTGSDTFNVDTISASGDTASIKVTVSGSPNLSPFYWGMVYISPTPGNFLILSSTGSAVLSASGARFIPPSGIKSVSSSEANESYVSNAFTAKAIYNRLGTAAGAGKAWDFSIKQNGTNTALLTNISGTTLTGGTITDVSIALDDRLVFQQNPVSGTPSTGTWKVGVLGYLNDSSNGNFFNMF